MRVTTHSFWFERMMLFIRSDRFHAFAFLQALQIKEFNQFTVQWVPISLTNATHCICTIRRIRKLVLLFRIFTSTIFELSVRTLNGHLVRAVCSRLRVALLQIFEWVWTFKQVSTLTWLLFTVWNWVVQSDLCLLDRERTLLALFRTIFLTLYLIPWKF